MQILKKFKQKNPLCLQRVFLLLIWAQASTLFGQTYLLNKSRLLSDICIKQPTPAIAVARIGLDTIEYGFTGFLTSKRKPKETVQELSKYHLGSNTKAITGLIAAKLVEMGQVSWDTSLLQLFPEWQGQIDTHYYHKTLADFLTHRAGVLPFTSGEEFATLPSFKGTLSEKRTAFGRFVLNQKPLPMPADSFLYSNAGYAIAALMLERATGMSWEILTKGLMDMLFLRYFIGFPNKEDQKLHAWGHLTETDISTLLIPQSPKNGYKLPDFLAPAGDIAMPILDYAILTQQFLRGACGTNGLVSAQSFEHLLFGKPNYAFGWRNISQKNNQAVKIAFHDGSLGTFYARTIIDVQKKRALVILTNSADIRTLEEVLPKIEQKLFR